MLVIPPRREQLHAQITMAPTHVNAMKDTRTLGKQKTGGIVLVRQRVGNSRIDLMKKGRSKCERNCSGVEKKLCRCRHELFKSRNELCRCRKDLYKCRKDLFRSRNGLSMCRKDLISS